MPTNSTRKATSRKAHHRPKKPYPDFPLYAHPLGYWSKKIRGKIVNFGRWARVRDGVLTPEPYEAGWTGALAVYKAQCDDLHAGRVPRPEAGDALTVAALCNRFLTAKKRSLDAREIGQRMFAEYKATTDMLVARFGPKRRVDDLASADFEKLRADLAERFGPVRLGNEIVKVKSVFRYGADSGLITQPVRYGGEFKKPGKAVLRKHKADSGGNMMEAGEVRAMIETAPPALRAMTLLMVNCGFGAMDCAQLPLRAIDLEGGWLDFPRPKTGIARRCPLWPETVAALREAIAARPKPADAADADLAFLTTRGRRWVGANATANPVSVAIVNVMRRAVVHRQGRGAYTLRHVFRTVADGSLDRVAIDLIMGHADSSMGANYRERIDDARLVAVTDHVRRWLFGVAEPGPAREDAHPTARNAQRDNATADKKAHSRPALRLFSPEVEGGAA
jgi:integrase